jgi:arylsulfatase A-like enzyme
MKKIVLIILLFFLLLSGQSRRKNILFIAVDDLKPLLGCYGDSTVVSPALDSLAERGVVFANAHAQQAVCAPSRASLLTGWRPDRTKVWDLETLIRDKNPDAVTLPQYLRENGYYTAAVGKVFDPRSVDAGHDYISWLEPYEKITAPKYMEATGNPAVESAEYPDEDYVDGKIADSGIELLKKASVSGKPFFVAIGFKKPHLPFVAPERYWDIYSRDQFSVNPFQEHAADSPEYAYQPGWELRKYDDIPAVGESIPDEKQKEVIHGYYACVSFIDAQIGKVLDELDSIGLKDSTVIVLWGDHGWHLGDHAMWAKHSNFEQATRSPLIIVDPSLPGKKYITSPVEFVDIFPTVCELAEVPVPDNLDGISLTPLLRGEKDKVKNFAVSQYRRDGNKEGYTIRTERYRYTEWVDINYREGLIPYGENIVIGKELYDYRMDPRETVSLIYDSSYREVMDTLKTWLSDFLMHQFGDSIAVDSSGNLLLNPGFEEGTAFWTDRACNLNAVSDAVHWEEKSLFISGRTKSWGGAGQVFTSALRENGPGNYVVSAWYRAEKNEDAAKVQLRLTTDDGSKKYIQFTEDITAYRWTQLIDTVNLSWNGILEEALITMMATGDMTNNYYVDDILIIPDSLYTGVAGNDRRKNIPSEYGLLPNYPNPFNPGTNITFVLSRKSWVKLTVYNLLGRKIKVLAEGYFEAGAHHVAFNADRLASGTYLYVLETPDGKYSGKMVLLK